MAMADVPNEPQQVPDPAADVSEATNTHPIDTSTPVATPDTLPAVPVKSGFRESPCTSCPTTPGTALEIQTPDELVARAENTSSAVRWQEHEPPVELKLIRFGTPPEIRRIIKQSLIDLQQSATPAVSLPAPDARVLGPGEDAPMLANEPELDLPTVEPATESGSPTSPPGELGHQNHLSVGSARTTGSSEASQDSLNRLSTLSLSTQTSISSTATASTFSKAPANRYSHIGPLGYTALYSRRADAGVYTGERYVQPKLESPYAKKFKRMWKDRKGEGECASCLDDMKNKELTSLACQHKYCKACLTRLVSTSMTDENYFPPKCCLQELPSRLIQAHLTWEQKSLYKLKLKEYAVPIADRWYCPHPACGRWIDVGKRPRSLSNVKCPGCKTLICPICRGLAHNEREDCPKDSGLEATLETSLQEGWRRCFKCRAMVELTAGCRHITCKCKAEFCYVCGDPWRTCECTEADMLQKREEIKRLKDANNVEESSRDAARRGEEAETAAAIAAVARAQEQEAREERRMERLRQLDEDRKRTEAAQKARKQEVIRIYNISQRFIILRGSLDSTHQSQLSALQERHERELHAITEAQKKSSAAYAAAWDATMAEMEARKREAIARAEQAQQDTLANLAVRHEEEEDDYFLGIRAHLRGKPNREAREKAALEKVQQNQAEEREALVRTQQEELRALIEAEAVSLEEEKRAAATRHLEANHRDEQEVLDRLRKHVADQTWYTHVVALREFMLAREERDLVEAGPAAGEVAAWSARMEIAVAALEAAEKGLGVTGEASTKRVELPSPTTLENDGGDRMSVIITGPPPVPAETEERKDGLPSRSSTASSSSSSSSSGASGADSFSSAPEDEPSTPPPPPPRHPRHRAAASLLQIASDKDTVLQPEPLVIRTSMLPEGVPV